MIDTKRASQELNFQMRPGMHFHLVGIGGSGLSAIARVLLGKGFVVSGSDQQTNETTASLLADGVKVYQGHRRANIRGADVLVISSAVPEANAEVMAAVDTGVPVLKRADLLGSLMEGTFGIAVAGTHGKTTTTGMIAHVLMETGLDPTVIVGGLLPTIGANGRFGTGNHFIVEADEYDYMFLGLRPQLAVVTNLEHDHPDFFATMADYMGAFHRFVSLLPKGGGLVACVDDPGVVRLLDEVRSPEFEIITYGVNMDDQTPPPTTYRALDCRANQLGGMDFLVEGNSKIAGLARIRVPGLHNVRNAMAAIIVAQEIGVPFHQICQVLATFGGVGRRFQVIGEVRSVTVIDDYAHHPSEIKATLAAARQRYPGRRLWAVWQPHTYSRTRSLLDGFASSFADADRVVALDIYRSREQDTMGIDTGIVLAAMDHAQAVHIAELVDAANYILDRLLPGDVVLTLSAGDGNLVGKWVLDGLKKRLNEE
jgi:UDP-N-acetylmuramate--alanine ligase